MADDQADKAGEETSEPDSDLRASQPGIEAPLSQQGGPPAAAEPAVPSASAAAETSTAAAEDAASPAATPDASQPPAGATAPFHPSYLFLFLVTVLNLGADLWSKHWAKSHFEAIRAGESRRVVLFENVVNTGMNFIFAKNKGGAWGLLQNETESLRRPFFLIVSVAAIVFIVSLYRKLTPQQRALKWGLPLVLGGALGNLVDRIRYGYVVDFIDVYMNTNGQVKHWPTFNVADIAICVGVGLMAIDMFTARDKKAKAAAAATDIKPSADATPPSATETDAATEGAAPAPAGEVPGLDTPSEEQTGNAPSAPPLGG